jgi:hypothetical protein
MSARFYPINIALPIPLAVALGNILSTIEVPVVISCTDFNNL